MSGGGGEVVVGFRRTADANTWSATWRVPAGAVGATYRVRVDGQAYEGAATAPYQVVSGSVRITP